MITYIQEETTGKLKFGTLKTKVLFFVYLYLVTLMEEFQGHDDGIISLEFAGSNMLYSGSYDHSIRSWDLKEM
jgi:WD40 repeat protein